jgi:hypothetical protein
VPDLGLAIGGRKTRVAELMRAGRFVLLDLTAGGRVAATAVNWPTPFLSWRNRSASLPRQTRYSSVPMATWHGQVARAMQTRPRACGTP